jgi:hypothetical protein
VESKKPFFVRAIWHDDAFTYIPRRCEGTAGAYEVKTASPRVVNFQVENGIYVVPKVHRAGVSRARERTLFFRGTAVTTMADLEPQTVTLTDKRPSPRGALPKGLLTWAMGGVAAIILLITLFAGSPKPVPHPAGSVTPAPQAPNADRLNEYQRQVRSIEERARANRRADAACPARPLPDAWDDASACGPGPGTRPTGGGRKRRRCDSLFASNVVASRRTGTVSWWDRVGDHRPARERR